MQTSYSSSPRPDQAVMAQAETPALVIVGGPVGDPVRKFGYGEEMFPQLRKRKFRMHGHAVIDDVQVRRAKVDHFLPFRILHPRIPDVPFQGHGPVEYACAARDFVDCQGDVALYAAQRFPQAVARDAPAKGIKFGHKLMHVTAGGIPRDCRQGPGAGHTSHPGVVKSEYSLSRSEMTRGASGHSMPKDGSFHLNPRAAPGA